MEIRMCRALYFKRNSRSNLRKEYNILSHIKKTKNSNRRACIQYTYILYVVEVFIYGAEYVSNRSRIAIGVFHDEIFRRRCRPRGRGFWLFVPPPPLGEDLYVYVYIYICVYIFCNLLLLTVRCPENCVRA